MDPRKVIAWATVGLVLVMLGVILGLAWVTGWWIMQMMQQTAIKHNEVTAQATVALVLATAMLVLVTLVLAGVTAWFMRQQNNRAKTELFLQLRQSAISPEHAARRRRVIALLMHLEERGLNSGDLKFSPDINLYLNDYEWIGRLVKDDTLQVEYAFSTYGRNLLLLYPKLKLYIKKEQDDRKYLTLWKNVSDLYNKFKQLDKDKLTPHIDEQLKIERRWLRPATILKIDKNRLEEIEKDNRKMKRGEKRKRSEKRSA